MPARRYPISDAAIAAAARFIREGSRAYTRAGEPSHPSLRQVAAHLIALRLADRQPPAATLGRALARAGVVLPAHWRQRTKKKLEVNISRGDRWRSGAKKKAVVARDSLCSSVDDGGTRTTRRRAFPELAHQALDHPWRRQQLSIAGRAP